MQKKTDKQVIQAFFNVHGDELRNACWDHVFFDDLMPKLAAGAAPAVASAPAMKVPGETPPDWV
jgi:hypothetical protein